MTKQELFDKVANHLLTQNKISFKKSICAYYGENNLKCAIGCLIPENSYNKKFEGIGIYILLNEYEKYSFPKELRDELIPYQFLLRKLQWIHDSFLPFLWQEQLKVLSEQESLNFNYNDYSIGNC